MWIQIHINIDFTKLGAIAFIISFLGLQCGAHLIHQPTADNLRDATIKNIKILLVFMLNDRYTMHLLQKKKKKNIYIYI